MSKCSKSGSLAHRSHRLRSAVRADSSNDYLQTLLREMNYLSQFGVNSTVIQIQLSAREKILESRIGELLQIIDTHKNYWTLTGSRSTLNALIEARTCMLGLLDAVHSSEYRLEKTCAAIYKHDLKTLMKAIRAPIIRAKALGPSQEGERFRSVVAQDRRRIKAALKEIVIELKAMCADQIDPNGFLEFARAPKAAIEAWCNEVGATIESFNEAEDFENAEGIEIVHAG